MKILHVLNHFLPQHIAGSEMYAYNLGKESEHKGLEVLYVIPNYGSARTEEYRYDGMRVIKYGEPSLVDRALQMGKRKPAGLANFIKVLQKERPDIVHFHEIAGSNGITFAHVEAAKKLGFKIVMTFHVSRYTAAVDNGKIADDIFDLDQGLKNIYSSKGFGGNLLRMMVPASDIFRRLNIDVTGLGKVGTALSMSHLVERKKKDFLKLVEDSDKVVTIAKWYHELLLRNNVDKNKLSFIEQGINISDLPVCNTQPQTEKLRLIFIGRISHIKGVKMLIEAVCQLNPESVHLDIFGDSGEDDHYKDDCRTLINDKTNIQLKGRLEPQDALATIASYDLLVLTSTVHEMSPLVIREAFAAGVPVLASDNMGAKEQIQDGTNGWLFKMNEAEDLAEELKWLIGNPEKIREASRHIPAPRSFSDVAVEYLKLYQEVLETSN